MKKNWRNLILVFLFFLFLRFYPAIFQGKVSVFGDNYSLMVPGKVYLAENIKAGVLPLWNPEIFSGIPLINDVNQSVLYFSTLIFLIFPSSTALNVSVISHVVLIMLGTYLLLKHLFKKEEGALLGALLIGLSTQVSGSINNLSTIQSVTWFPWIAYFGLKLHKQKNSIFLYALFVLLHFLAGYPQHVIYSIAFSVLLSIFYNWQKIKFWDWLKVWMLTAAFVLALSAIVWMPFLEMLLDSTRMSQSLEQGQVGSLKPGMLVKMFFPYFFDKQSAGIKWGPSWTGQPNVFFYIGNFALFILGMVFLDKKQRKKEDLFYAIFIISTIIFSLGSYLPGFDFIQRVIPLFKFGRYPSMVLIVTNLALAMWLTSAFPRVKINKFWKKIFSMAWIGVLLASLIWFYFIIFDFQTLWHGIDSLSKGYLSNSVFHTLARDWAISKMVATNLLTASIFALLALWAFSKKKTKLLVLIMVMDLLVHTQGMFYFAPKDIYQYQGMNLFSEEMKDKQHRSLIRNSNMPYTDYGTYWQAMAVRAPFSDSFIDDQELQTYEKLIHIRDAYTPNWNIMHDLPVVHGYTTLLPRDYADIWSLEGENRINFVDFIEPSNPKLQDWAVKYYLVDNLFEIKEEIPFKEIARDGDYVLYELPEAKARFRFANDQAVEFLDFQENPNQISFSFENEAQAELIIADRFDRNWRAWINDEEVEIENYQGMRKLKISNGSNSVLLKFCPQTFYYGAILTGLTAMGILIYLLLSQKIKIAHL